MKATGIVRKVDELGRIVIPIELRRTFGIRERDPLEIYLDDGQIVFQKYKASEQACAVTGEVSSDNFLLGSGNIVLSPEGARILAKELKQKLD
jgi:AbrB family transcriptional regulator, transcriptional pleiotropic regulator of transition state genes